jgi:hypothetical protein
LGRTGVLSRAWNYSALGLELLYSVVTLLFAYGSEAALDGGASANNARRDRVNANAMRKEIVRTGGQNQV